MKNFLISLMLFVVPSVSMAGNEDVNNGVLIPFFFFFVNGSIKNRPIKLTPPLFPLLLFMVMCYGLTNTMSELNTSYIAMAN